MSPVQPVLPRAPLPPVRHDAVFSTPLPALVLAENRDGSSVAIALARITATDANADPLRYSLDGSPSDWLIDPASGLISYRGTGLNFETAPTVPLTGRTGADRFDLRIDFTGTNTITDFSVSDGDVIQLSTSDTTTTSWAGQGLAIRDEGADAHIFSASDTTRIYMILEDIDHTHLLDNFSTYVELY